MCVGICECAGAHLRARARVCEWVRRCVCLHLRVCAYTYIHISKSRRDFRRFWEKELRNPFPKITPARASLHLPPRMRPHTPAYAHLQVCESDFPCSRTTENSKKSLRTFSRLNESWSRDFNSFPAFVLIQVKRQSPVRFFKDKVAYACVCAIKKRATESFRTPPPRISSLIFD